MDRACNTHGKDEKPHTSWLCVAEALREISTDGRILQKSRRMRLAGHVARMVTRRCVYRVLAGKPEGKRPLGRHRRRWEDNIKIDL
jgi:hypothetical protein